MRVKGWSFHRNNGCTDWFGRLLVVTFGASVLMASMLATWTARAAVENFSGIGSFNGVACASSNQCLGVGIIYAAGSSGAEAAAAPLDPTTGALSVGQSVHPVSGVLLSGVACPSATQCLAVGESSDGSEGTAVALDPDTGAVSSGQSIETIPGIVLSDVACASTTQCLAVGHGPTGSGVAVPLNPTTGAIASGESVQTITAGVGDLGLQGVACSSTSQCVAVGVNAAQTAGAAVSLNPATGTISGGQSVQSVTTKGVLYAVSCPSTTECLAVGSGGGPDLPSIAVPLVPATAAVPVGQGDQTISARAGMLSAVSCPSTSQCLAVGDDKGDPSNGQAVPLNPATGTISSGQSIENVAGTGALNATTCPSPTQCLAAGYGFGASGGATEVLSATTALPVTNPPPVTSVVIPSNGALLSGSDYLDASATSNAGITEVQFVLTGGSLNKTVVGTAVPTIFGYLYLLDTTTVANGAYTLQSLAYDGGGSSAYSAGVTVTVDNSPPPASWMVVPSPDGSPTSNDSLTSVSCPTASFCAAVGSSSGSPLIETDQGSAWSITPSADTSPPSLAGLNGVSCTSSSFCMAVGAENEVPGGTPYNPTSEVPAAETWNGSSWQLIPVPDNGAFGGAYRGDVLNAVSCISPSFCAAVGVTTVRGPGEVATSSPSGYVETWNGSTWSVTSTGGEAEGVSCSNTDLCVAVGTQGGAQVNGIVTLPPDGGPSFVDSYDGTTWNLTTFPVPPTNSLYSGATLTAVSCVGTWCLATGIEDLFTQTSPESGTETSTLIDARYDGTSWSTTAVPAPPAQPNGLACVAADSCIGVGGGSNIEELSSNIWSMPPSPQFSGTFNSVSCGTISACTAVGTESGPPTRTLIAVGPSSSEQASISGAPPSGTVGAPYSFSFTTAGVPSPVVSSSGMLPPGLTLSASGVLAGTPTAAGSYSFTLNASNGAGSPAFESVTLVVGRADTVTSIVSSADPAAVGQHVTYTASVSVASPGVGAPSGTVKFTDNRNPIAGCGAALVSSGEASCNVRYSVLGSHSIVATYSGDANFTGSASPIMAEQTVEGISLRITGALNYTNAGPVTAGQITVLPHGSGPVTSVVGTGQLAGIDGGFVTVTFDIHTIFGFSFGTILIEDPGAHVGLYAPVNFGRTVRLLSDEAAGSTTGLAVNHGALGLSHLSWSVDD